MKKTISILGSTGSIGLNSLKIIDKKKNKIRGKVKVKLYKGNISIVSRSSNSSVYSIKKVSFEENKTFNKKNVENFIKKHCKLLKR